MLNKIQLKRTCNARYLFVVTVKVSWKSWMEVMKFKASVNIKNNKEINVIKKEHYFSA